MRLALILPLAVTIFVPPGHAAPQATRGDGILIEMEAYDEKASETPTFATPTRESAASGRRVLARFFERGHVIYRFAVPTDGVYTGWLRYGSKGEVSIGAARDRTKLDLSQYETPPPPCTGVRVALRGYGMPKRVFEAVSGRELAPERTPHGIEMAVPEFEYMAVVVAEF